MNIEILVDRDGGLDSSDPLGDLIFIDESNKNKIELRQVFIDSWLASIVENLSEIDKKSEVICTVLEQNEKLKFVRNNVDTIAIYFNNITVTSNYSNFISQLREAIKNFINIFKEDYINPNLKYLSEWIMKDDEHVS